jgi:hypothetical protein
MSIKETFRRQNSVMAIRLHPFDIGCEPSPSVPAETLLQDGREAYLLFFAVSKVVDESGYLKDLGVAIVHFKDCEMTKFGYPNDEGLPEHPLYKYGIANAKSSVLEVIDSPWQKEILQQRVASVSRIRRNDEMGKLFAKNYSRRHFVITLAAATVECIASEIYVERYCKTFEEAYAHVIQEFIKH